MTDETNPIPGAFIVLDGPDGGGKTTQVAKLVEWLGAMGRQALTCRDPGGTALGDRLRSILLERGSLLPTLRAEMLLFMASRAQLVEEVVRPAIAEGKVVVSDRYLLANIVYQGYAGGLGVEEVGRVGLVATGGLLPDLTILLDLPISLARARVRGARDRLEDRPESYHERVREGFLRASSEANGPGGCSYYPAPVARVDASADAEAVFERLRSEVGRVLALGSRP
ncbi:MAG: dTMP kinase [Isosphaeraceae bacterium]